MILPEKWYNIAKWFVTIVLPAIGAAVFSLQNAFDISNAEQITGVCSVLAIFLGTVLGISTKNYNTSDKAFDGDMIMTQGEDGDTFRLELNSTPEELAAKDNIRFKKIVEAA